MNRILAALLIPVALSACSAKASDDDVLYKTAVEFNDAYQEIAKKAIDRGIMPQKFCRDNAQHPYCQATITIDKGDVILNAIYITYNDGSSPVKILCGGLADRRLCSMSTGYVEEEVLNGDRWDTKRVIAKNFEK